MKNRFLVGLLVLVLASGCASYYKLQGKFNDYFELGEYAKAEEMLAKQKKAEEKRNRLLYFFNRGLVSFLQGKHEESNDFFEKAVLFYDTETKKLGLEILTNFSNPNITPYYGESFEHLYVNYYKAHNYLALNDLDAALVECRRLTTKLNALNDEYEGKNKFKNDAYFLNFIGMVYEADRDYNNAFIAYRNALKVYESDYSQFFAIDPPRQLKEDLLRTAYLSGITSEYEYYRKSFGFDIDKNVKREKAELLAFWHNGLGPVKEEWSLNFVSSFRNGELYFVNEQYGYSVHVPQDQAQRKGMSDVHMIRVAFPRYAERPLRHQNATITTNRQSLTFEKAESVNGVAFQTLEDRMAKEVGKAVLRMVVKKATELAARDQNNELGTVLGAVNFFTEYADTRNWQTLPHSISYRRIYLDEGSRELIFSTEKGAVQKVDVEVKKGCTYFHVFRTLGAAGPIN